MPIFMDRHYSEDATRSAIEFAHEKDLKIQDQHGVKFLTYWFDEDRHTTFCLVEAPDKQAIQNAHDEAHGGIPHEIIEVDPAAVEAFLGRVKDPIPVESPGGSKIDDAFRAIMFTDLKDSTLMTTIHGDSKALHLLHIHNAITRNALREHHGREVKHTGDGIMAAFNSVPDAVKCSRDIAAGFNMYNAENPEDELFVRIGVSAGEPIEEDGDLFGSTVQMAARLCAHAEPNKILVSQIIIDHCKGMQNLFSPKGKVNMKGFSKDVEIFELLS